MRRVDAARRVALSSMESACLESFGQERFVIELESQGTDFHTVFKNQLVSLDANKELLVNSIITILEVRGFVLREQVISYFSRRAKCYVAVAKRPIPSDAVIPQDDIDKNGRLTLKIWPPEHLPESLVVDLDCQPKLKVAMSPQIGTVKEPVGNGMLDATIKSSFEGSAANHGLPSLSSGTSYGKEPIYENTIEQILGNIERSNLGDLKDHSHDSFAESKRFAKQLEDRIFGIQKQQASEVAQKMLNGAKKGSSILGIKRLEPMSHVRPMPLCNKDS